MKIKDRQETIFEDTLEKSTEFIIRKIKRTYYNLLKYFVLIFDSRDKIKNSF